MGILIHAQKTDGEILFRLWSTETDSYVTKEITENELRRELLIRALIEAVNTYFLGIDERIQRTSKKGTSSQEDTRDLNSPWDEEG
jgi:hypothetical protein